MRLTLTYLFYFLFMKYILKIPIIDIIMLQGFFIIIVLLCFMVKSFGEFLADYKKNSKEILGKDKKVLNQLSILKIKELIVFIIIGIIIFIFLLKNYSINKPMLKYLYNWEIPLQKVSSILYYLNKLGITLVIISVGIYINYVFKLNKQRINYNITFDKFIYYLKYTFIKFLIYFSYLVVITISTLILINHILKSF